MACVMSASPVPPMEFSPEMEAALGAETVCEPMTVPTRQEKILEKPNLDGLSNWTPRNMVVVSHPLFLRVRMNPHK